MIGSGQRESIGVKGAVWGYVWNESGEVGWERVAIES